MCCLGCGSLCLAEIVYSLAEIHVYKVELLVLCIAATIGGGSQEAGGRAHIRAGRHCGHEEPEHCTDNPHRQPSNFCLLAFSSYTNL